MHKPVPFLLLFILSCGGCLSPGSPSIPTEPRDEQSSSLSLVDIGEASYETAEVLERQGLRSGALEAYERALWAFTYHQQLTGQAPLFLTEAEAGVKRLQLAPAHP